MKGGGGVEVGVFEPTPISPCPTVSPQALHCVGFATAQLLAVYVYLPTVYDPSAGGGVFSVHQI